MPLPLQMFFQKSSRKFRHIAITETYVFFAKADPPTGLFKQPARLPSDYHNLADPFCFGNPAKPVRRLKAAEIEDNLHSAALYVELKERYRK